MADPQPVQHPGDDRESKDPPLLGAFSVGLHWGDFEYWTLADSGPGGRGAEPMRIFRDMLCRYLSRVVEFLLDISSNIFL